MCQIFLQNFWLHWQLFCLAFYVTCVMYTFFISINLLLSTAGILLFDLNHYRVCGPC
jgi:hypothetical protein